MTTTVHDRFAQLFEEYPAFRALLRSVEEHLVAEQSQSFCTPILDLGCGDGRFGQRALHPHSPIGLDPSFQSLFEAASSGTGNSDSTGPLRLVGGSATNLPFAGDSFRTILVNSVFEHIEQLEPALDECRRVLSAGGLLVVTAPNPRFSEHLLAASCLRTVGARGLAHRYARWFNRHSEHHHLLTQESWKALLEARRFELILSIDYVSPGAHKMFDLLHYLGLPALVARRMTGQWVPWRNPITRWLAHTVTARFASTAPHPRGAYTFLIAKAT